MRILIGYDGSESADAAIDDLRRAGLPPEAEALIVSVSGGLVNTASSVGDVTAAALTSRRVTSAIAQAEAQAAQAFKEAREFAAKAGDRVRSYFPDWEVQTEARAGNPSTELMNRANEWKADLIVVGSQGRSAVGRFILGTVSKKVVTNSNHSVRVVRGDVRNINSKPPRVMIGVDGSPEAEHAVRAVGMRV